MNGTTETKVTAETDGEVVETTHLAFDSKKVGESLGGVAVATVTSIDNRNPRIVCSHKCSTLLKVAHCDNVCKAVDGASGVGASLTFGNRRALCIVKTENRTTKFQHRCCETQSCASTWLIEERCEFFTFASLRVFLAVFDNILRKSNNLIKFLHRKVGGVN